MIKRGITATIERDAKSWNLWSPSRVHSTTNFIYLFLDKEQPVKHQILGTDFERINCLRIAFSSSICFFSCRFVGLIFLFSSSIHSKSSRCLSSGMGCRTITGLVTGGSNAGSSTGGVLVSVGVETTSALLSVLSLTLSFLPACANIYAAKTMTKSLLPEDFSLTQFPLINFAQQQYKCSSQRYFYEH